MQVVFGVTVVAASALAGAVLGIVPQSSFNCANIQVDGYRYDLSPLNKYGYDMRMAAAQ